MIPLNPSSGDLLQVKDIMCCIQKLVLRMRKQRALVGEKVESLRRRGPECIYLDVMKMTGRDRYSSPCAMW